MVTRGEDAAQMLLRFGESDSGAEAGRFGGGHERSGLDGSARAPTRWLFHMPDAGSCRQHRERSRDVPDPCCALRDTLPMASDRSMSRFEPSFTLVHQREH